MPNFPTSDGSIQSRQPAGGETRPTAAVEQSDLELVRRAQRGERGAFDLLVLRYQHKVVKLVARLLRDPTEAEDVAQEAFERLKSLWAEAAASRYPPQVSLPSLTTITKVGGDQEDRAESGLAAVVLRIRSKSFWA